MIWSWKCEKINNYNYRVSETPINDDEGIEGCHNRIEDAINQNVISYVINEE